MKKREAKKAKKILLVVLIIFIMLLSISTTWLFWNAGINNTDADNNININIGEAGTVDTVLNITNSTTPGATLIPHDAPLLASTDVHEIVFATEVFWRAENSAHAIEMDGVVGNLSATVTQIMIGDTNFLYTTGLNNLSIFVVEINAGATVLNASNPATIIGNDDNAVVVTIRITMNRPRDRAQYLQLINQQVSFSVNFAVTVVD